MRTHAQRNRLDDEQSSVQTLIRLLLDEVLVQKQLERLGDASGANLVLPGRAFRLEYLVSYLYRLRPATLEHIYEDIEASLTGNNLVCGWSGIHRVWLWADSLLRGCA